MKLQSCQNCWFNGLQYGSVGLPVGYCARHRKVLNASDQTTCGLHIRKDLGLKRAQQVSALHSEHYDKNLIVRIESREALNKDFSTSNRDTKIIRSDEVGDIAYEYGYLDSKIESLSQLRNIRTARADIALSSLGRAYIRTCIRNDGRWTSGIHLYWWMKKRLATMPFVEINDLRFTGSLQVSRQVYLAQWSIIMLKLTLIEDIVNYAKEQGDEIGQINNITNSAAAAVPSFNIKKLSAWIKNELIPALDLRLNNDRYSEISRELHKDTADK